MRSRSLVLSLFLVFVTLQSVASIGYASQRASNISRSYPIDSAREVSPDTKIGITIIGTTADFNIDSHSYSVIGSESGVHEGKIAIGLDRATVIFQPIVPFSTNEIVDVLFRATGKGGIQLADTLHFTTAKHQFPSFTKLQLSNYIHGSSLNAPAVTTSEAGKIEKSLLSLPEFATTSDVNPFPGRIFLSVQGVGQRNPDEKSGYLVILDEHGKFLSATPVNGADFELQPNGEMTYCDGQGHYLGLDSNYTIVDSFACVNGATADGHEIRINENGDYTLLGVEQVTMDLSWLVAGGNTQARVVGNVIQTFDRNGNLLFEWRGIDHYKLVDAQFVDFLQDPVDFEHANSIDIDADGNYLLSNRHLCEITKIDGKTGEFLWRFGGKENEFAIQNDSIGFSYQHFARWLPNGHLLFYDNGNHDKVQESRAVEYAMDQSNKIATQTWDFRHSPATYGYATGSAQRLANGNTLIGWGIDSAYSATEVDPQGNVVFELSMPSPTTVPNFSYRVLKYLPNPNGAPNAVASTQSIKGFTCEIVDHSNRDYTLDATNASPLSASVNIYDLQGRLIQSIFEGSFGAGKTSVSFSLKNSAAGTYFVVIETSLGKIIRRIVVGS